MNKYIAKIFKSAGVSAKVSKDSENPRFKVVDNKLTLEGIIKDGKYSMKIRDYKGKIIDNMSVTVSNGNDIVNRVNESLNTLKTLSKVYENNQLREEEEEFDDVVVNEDEPDTLTDGLDDLYDAILDVAEKAENLSDLADEDDAEQLSTLIGFSSSLYDCAIDVDEYREDLIEEEADENDDDVTESFKKVKISKGNARKALDNLTLAESILRKCEGYSDIVKAIKDIKSEMIVRGR